MVSSIKSIDIIYFLIIDHDGGLLRCIWDEGIAWYPIRLHLTLFYNVSYNVILVVTNENFYFMAPVQKVFQYPFFVIFRGLDFDNNIICC